MLTPQITLAAGGALLIEGSELNDVTEMTQTSGGGIRATIDNGVDSVVRTYSQTSVSSIVFRGGAGDDTLRNETSVPTEAHGEGGNDLLIGGSGDDLMFGQLGDDTLLGRGGDDTLRGGDGNDDLKGHNGADLLTGGLDDDTLSGGGGDDILDGGLGNDELNGGSGDDLLIDVDPTTNNPPQLELLNTVTTLSEATDTAAELVIADIVVTDDGNGNNILSLGGTDAALFKINTNRLILKSGTSLDASTNPTLDVTVRVNDLSLGGTFDDQQSLSIEVLDTTNSRLYARDFGAVGDGVTDDTQALQAALDAAVGLELYLNPGTYLISDSLLISSHTTLSGAGGSSILKFNWRDRTEGAEFHLGNRNRADEVDGDTNIVLRDLTLIGGDDGTPFGPDNHTVTHGILFRKVSNVQVTGLEIRNTSGFGIANAGLINGTFTGNTIENVGRDGITSFPIVQEDDPSIPTYALDGLVISNNQFTNVGDDAIAVHAGTEFTVNSTLPPTNITINGNTIVGRTIDDVLAQGRGIVLTGVHDATIDGNSISRTVSTGILIQSWYNFENDPDLAVESIRSDNIVVANNTVMEAGGANGLVRVKIGVQIKGTDRIQLIDNTIRDSADRGVDVRNTTQIDIIGNTVTGSQGKYGILIAGGPAYDVSDVIVTSNTVEHWNDGGLLLHNVINGITNNNLVT